MLNRKQTIFSTFIFIIALTLVPASSNAQLLTTEQCQEISSCSIENEYSSFIEEIQNASKKSVKQAAKALKRSCAFVRKNSKELGTEDSVEFQSTLKRCKKFLRTYKKNKKQKSLRRVKKQLSKTYEYLKGQSANECTTAWSLYCNSENESSEKSAYYRMGLPVGMGPNGEIGGSAGGCGVTIFMCDPICQEIESPAEASFCTAALNAGVCFADSGQCSGPYSTGQGGGAGAGANGGGANGGDGDGGDGGDQQAADDPIAAIEEAIAACNEDQQCLCDLLADTMAQKTLATDIDTFEGSPLIETPDHVDSDLILIEIKLELLCQQAPNISELANEILEQFTLSQS